MGTRYAGVKFGVKLSAVKDTERDDVEPEEERDACSERSVDLRVIGETGHIPPKSERRKEPQCGGEEGTRKHALPGLLHRRPQVIDKADDANACREGHAPADNKGDCVDRCLDFREDIHGKPVGNELSEDDEHRCDGERCERERNEKERAAATLDECPAIDGKLVGTTNTLHESCDDAGGSDEADHERGDKRVGGASAVGFYEVALEERADVWRKNAIEEERELKAEGSVVGKETDDGSCSNERRKEGHHRRVGGRLGQVQAVVPACSNHRAVEDAGKTHQCSYGIHPRSAMRTDHAFHLLRKSVTEFGYM